MKIAHGLNQHVFFDSDDEEPAPPVLRAEEEAEVPGVSSSDDTVVYDAQAECQAAGVEPPKRKRKSRPDPTTWKKGKAKTGRLSGKTHPNRAGVIKDKRRMGPPCITNTCRVSGRQCGAVTERERAAIFRDFWLLPSWNERRTFLKACTDVVAKGPARTTNKWRLKLQDGRCIEVCRPLVASTLGMSPRTLTYWLGRRPQQRPHNTKAAKTGKFRPVSDADKEYLNTWLEGIPTVPSHYCRQVDRYREMKFFEPGTTVAKLHREYKAMAMAEDRRVLSVFTFTKTLKDNKFSVFIPKKDMCDICVAFDKKATGALPRAQYREHRAKAAAAKQERASDEELASGTDDVAVFTMDLQAVLCLPRTRAGAQYYKRKLQVHNLTFFNKKYKDGYNFLWDETQGELDGDVFASIISKFIKEITHKRPYNRAKTIIVWSDNCQYQNKNQAVANAMLQTARDCKVKIVQKYLTKGHTMMECDSMHSSIEHRIRNVDLLVPAELAVAVQSARVKPRPYEVTVLNHMDFSRLDGQFVHPYAPAARPVTKQFMTW